MAGSRQVIGVLLAGLLLWAGLGLLGPQAPWASERPAAEMGNRPAQASPPAGSVELRCQGEQPLTILFMVPPGKAVKKGDLLIELDASALTDKRIQQVFQTRKTQTDMILAKETQHAEKQAAGGQIDLAQRALRLAQSRLRAFTEGEYPNQLALASGTAALAEQKSRMLDYQRTRLQAATKSQKDEAAEDALQEAEMALREAQMQSYAAKNSLALLKSFGHDNKVAELELAVAQREFDVARAKDALTAAEARGGAIYQLAEACHQMEADRLAKLDDQIRQSKIYAPQDGTIDQPRNADEAAVKPGAVVREQQVLLRLLPATPSKP